jgi:hypothetical protein
MELRSAVPLKTNSHAAAPSAVANDGVSGFGFDIFQGDARGYAFERRRLDQALVKSVERGHVRDDNAQSIVGVACQAIKPATSTETKTVTPNPSFLGSSNAMRRLITPAASSR